MPETFPFTHDTVHVNDEGDVVPAVLHTPTYRRGQGEDAESHMTVEDELHLDHPFIAGTVEVEDDTSDIALRPHNPAINPQHYIDDETRRLGLQKLRELGLDNGSSDET